jgi:hypothetical protein
VPNAAEGEVRCVAEDLSWVPPGVDTGKASVARVYDYWLGGTHNFQADRDAARAMIAVDSNVRAIARANREFLRRAVSFLVDAGIRQFLDIGSGIPSEGNVHEIAQQAAPGSRVVYVDADPVAVAHSRAMLAGNPDAGVLQADLREPHRILGSAEVTGLLDLAAPVGLLLCSILHFISDDDDPWLIVGSLRDALAPGSYLVLSHATSEGVPATVQSALTRAYQGRVETRGGLRSRAEIERFFAGFHLVAPGVVLIRQWRPGLPAAAQTGRDEFWFLAGAGRKP